METGGDSLRNDADSHDKGNMGRNIGLIAAIIAGYVLSIGPVYMMFLHSNWDEMMLEYIYFPVIMLVEHSDLFQGFMHWYLGFFT